MKKLFAGLFLMTSLSGVGQVLTESYSRVKVFATSDQLTELMELGVPVDHGEVKKNTWIITDLSQSEISTVQAYGLVYEVLIEDVKEYYLEQLSDTLQSELRVGGGGCGGGSVVTTPANFNLGSMGGYLTYSEFLSEIDDMAATYPALISVKQPIFSYSTYEGRPIYYLKISDNVGVDEAEPEVLYTAIHHAREPLSLSQLVYFMWYVLENYATDAEVQYIVDNTEMFFVPVVNPDGYIYNEATDPTGGGMWRKNRRNNGGGAYGVDNNRNYDYFYGFSGASTDPWNETYRGTGAFSEPENQALRDLINSRDFAISLNAHSYGDYLLYPFGYDYVFTTEDAEYQSLSSWMTGESSISPLQAVDLYPAAGDSDDWSYGETTDHTRIFAFTPEIGDGFWPSTGNIEGICQYMLPVNMSAALAAGSYAEATDVHPRIVENINGYFKFDIQQIGLDVSATYTVSIVPIGTDIQSVGSPQVFSGMSLFQTLTDSIAYTLSPSIASGQVFQYVLAWDNGSYTWNDTITKIYGIKQVAFAHSGSSLSGWNTSSWNTTTEDYYSASSSITDSPFADYSNNSNDIITTSNPVDLTDALSATLNFWATWEIETGYDYCQVEISTDGGGSWTPLCGKYTRAGSANQDPGNPVYDGFQTAWVLEEIDLDAYIGNNALFRFQLVSDGWAREDGFYFDDLEVVKIVAPVTSVEEQAEVGTILQNMPNPATELTYINYILQENESARLVVTNQVGQLISELPLDASKQLIELNVSGWESGIYFYYIQTASGLSEVKRLCVLSN